MTETSEEVDRHGAPSIRRARPLILAAPSDARAGAKLCRRPVCDKGERNVFTASKKGNLKDNPDDPTHLDETQKGRTIVFAFEDTSCWDVTLSHFCKIEEETWR